MEEEEDPADRIEVEEAEGATMIGLVPGQPVLRVWEEWETEETVVDRPVELEVEEEEVMGRADDFTTIDGVGEILLRRVDSIVLPEEEGEAEIICLNTCTVRECKSLMMLSAMHIWKGSWPCFVVQTKWKG